MIGVVGHADLTKTTLRLIESELHDRLRGSVGTMAGLARAGAGLPLAFARAARRAGVALVAVLPSAADFPVKLSLPGRDALAAGEMLVLAGQVRVCDYDPHDPDACVSADEAVIRSCRRVLAVWDGSRTTARDATAHLVAYARARGIPVDILWPTGATRDEAA